MQAAQSRTDAGGAGQAYELLLLPPEQDRLQRLTDVMVVLADAGASSRAARNVAEQLALGRAAYFTAPRIDDLEQFRAKLCAARVALHVLKPSHVDVKQLRESLGYSQAEFAGLLGFTLDSVQNWEQPNRPKPQGAALTILRMAQKDFDATIRLIAESQAA